MLWNPLRRRAPKSLKSLMISARSHDGAADLRLSGPARGLWHDGCINTRQQVNGAQRFINPDPIIQNEN
jgi:hypothetical protein